MFIAVRVDLSLSLLLFLVLLSLRPIILLSNGCSCAPGRSSRSCRFFSFCLSLLSWFFVVHLLCFGSVLSQIEYLDAKYSLFFLSIQFWIFFEQRIFRIDTVWSQSHYYRHETVCNANNKLNAIDDDSQWRYKFYIDSDWLVFFLLHLACCFFLFHDGLSNEDQHELK